MAKKDDSSKVSENFSSAIWRLNNLYYIIDRDGRKVKFRLNKEQVKLYDNLWYCNIILKARQLGISTFIAILFLDRCLWNSHVSAGIIAHTREDAEKLFKKVKFAYDHLPDSIRETRIATVSSAREVVFNNHSSLRVGTSMRSSTFQYLHISEFGKICAHMPEKAREIITGSLNTLSAKQYVFIESTAEGRSGRFYEMVEDARNLSKEKHLLTALDYKFHFFPWWECVDYRLSDKVTLPKEMDEYFRTLSHQGIELDAKQKAWYYKKMLTQKEDMKREFPSTPDEAFEVAIEGAFYSKWLDDARFEGRITNVVYDKSSLVFTAWDIGYNDSTSITFFQKVGNEIHVIDFYENSGEGLPHYTSVLKSKPYIYDAHYAPHDIESHAFSSGLSAKEVASSLGISFITLPTLKMRVEDGIEALRSIFPRLWIDTKNCAKLIDCLQNYRKEWDENLGSWKNRPRHDWASHGADSARYMAIAIKAHLDGSKGVTAEQDEKWWQQYRPVFE